MTTLESTIAENLKLAIAKTGMTQAATALAIGISKTKMSDVLAGKAALNVVELFKAAETFGVTTDWFSEEHLSELTLAA